jgi:alkylated DNA nucleotide flippase Atl1
MSREGSSVPWWRVVRVDGSLPESKGLRVREAYAVEGTPLRPSGRVDMERAFLRARVPRTGG